MTWEKAFYVALGAVSFLSTGFVGLLAWSARSNLERLTKGLESNKKALDHNTLAVTTLSVEFARADERHKNLVAEVDDLCDRMTSLETWRGDVRERLGIPPPTAEPPPGPRRRSRSS